MFFPEELINSFSTKLKNLLIKNNTKIYTLNAYDIANKVGLGNKISMIMECAILYLTNLIDYKFAKEELVKYIQDKFIKKGGDVVSANISALDMTENSIKEIKLLDSISDIENRHMNLYEAMFKREGNNLPTSAFLSMPSGVFKPGTTKLEEKNISEIVPHYISENCIECNQCAFVCPHSVIRPYLLSEEEYNNSPDYVKNRCKKAIGLEGYYFTIGICIKNCTGCGLCIKSCPGMKGEKALTFNSLSSFKLVTVSLSFNKLSLIFSSVILIHLLYLL